VATATSDIVISDIQPEEGLPITKGTCAWVLASNSGRPADYQRNLRLGAGKQ